MKPAIRRGWMVAAAVVAAGAVGYLSWPAKPAAAKPASVAAPPPSRRASNPKNIVMISIDTLRADHLSAYGYKRKTSPAIDQFASEAVLFENAFSHSPKTAPSHMTMMTGLLPDAHDVRNWEEPNPARLSQDIPTLAEILRQAGYRTRAHTGGGNVRAPLGFDRGFESYEAETERYRGDGNLAGAESSLEALARPGADGRRVPFFLFVHTYEVHDPYLPPAKYARRYVDPGYAGKVLSTHAKLLLAANNTNDYATLHKTYWDRVDPSSPADLQHIQDLYDALVTRMDERFARLAGILKQRGLLDDTMVVLLSDHGEEFFEHGNFVHKSIYREVLHVPLIIRFPGRSIGARRVAEVARLADLMPTLLEYVGLEIPLHAQGGSLLPLLNGAARSSWPVYSTWRRRGLDALQLDDWKYVRKGEAEELFDVLHDPSESHDLSGTNPARTRELRAAVERHSLECRKVKSGFSPGGAVAPDAGTQEELAALGYLGGGN